MLALVQVLSSFNPDQNQIGEQESERLSKKILTSANASAGEDSAMDFVEFAAWYRRTCTDLDRFRLARQVVGADAGDSAGTGASAMYTVTLTKSSTAGFGLGDARLGQGPRLSNGKGCCARRAREWQGHAPGTPARAPSPTRAVSHARVRPLTLRSRRVCHTRQA